MLPFLQGRREFTSSANNMQLFNMDMGQLLHGNRENIGDIEQLNIKDIWWHAISKNKKVFLGALIG